MFKYIGALLIFTSSALIGFNSSLIPLKRYKNLYKISNCFNTMKNEIRYSSDYIDEILKKVSKINDFSFIFNTTASIDKTISIAARWEKAVLTDSPQLNLKKEDSEILIMFGHELGMTDREGQLKIIDNLLSNLRTSITDAKEEYDKKSKLQKGLGISLGLFAIIILI